MADFSSLLGRKQEAGVERMRLPLFDLDLAFLSGVVSPTKVEPDRLVH